MAAQEYAANLLHQDQDEADNEDELTPAMQQTAGTVPRSAIDSSLRGNPGKWLLYHPTKLDELESHVTGDPTIIAKMLPATLPDHVKRVLETAGALEKATIDGLQPNYAFDGANLYSIDATIATANLQSWLNAANIESMRERRGFHPWLAPMPIHDPCVLRFSPDPIGITRMLCGASRATKDQAIAMSHIAHEFGTLGGAPIKQRARIIAVAYAMKTEDEIPAMDIVSRFGERPPPAIPTSGISSEPLGCAQYDADYADFCQRHDSEIKRIMGRCIEVCTKVHGANGTNSVETAGTSRLISRRNGSSETDSLLPGSGVLNELDAATQAAQVTWWDMRVTGWYAAYAFAIAILDLRTQTDLTKEEEDSLLCWTFMRSTYRRLASSDATLDSTRDIAASEVTQAASTAVKWQRNAHPILLILDDMEFAATRKVLPEHLQSVYSKVFKLVLSRVGTEHEQKSIVRITKPYGKHIVATGGREGDKHGLVYGQCIVTNSGARINPTPVSKSDAVLLSITKNKQPDGLRLVDHAGQKVLVVSQMHASQHFTYILPPTIQTPRLLSEYAFLSGMHFREDVASFPLPLVEFLALFDAHYEPMTPAQRAAALVRIADPVTTQQHHRHVSLVAMLGLSSSVWAPCLDSVLKWENVTNTFFTALALAFAALPPELRVLMQQWEGWARCESEDDYIKEAKNLSTKMKALDNQVALGDWPLDLAPLFEWDVLRHRASLSGNMDHEILERRDPGENINLSREKVRPHLDDIFRDIAHNMDKAQRGDKSPLYNEFSDFYDNRVSLTPAGSAFTLDDELLGARRQLRDVGVQDLTKTQVMAAMPDDSTLDRWLQQEKRIVAQISKKYEWSKVRTLFAGPMEHWIVGAFALGPIEEFMPHDCPIGKAADAHTVCRKVMQMSEGGVVACLDAKNFNILHQYDLMSEACLSASSILGDRLSGEQHKALRWLAEAELNQSVIITNVDLTDELVTRGRTEGWITDETLADGRVITLAKLQGGMFSGVRYTMLYNTFFNRVYYRIAQDIAGVKSKVLHSGDDVYAVFRNYVDVYKMKKALMSINYSLQLGKCFLEGVREFLRISHKNANTTQYLSRSAATAVHGRIEAGAPTDFVAYAGAILRRGAELIVRHANRPLILDIQKLQCGAACARWAVSNFTWATFLSIPAVLGGAAPEQARSVMWCGYTIERTAETRGPVVQHLAKLPGVRLLARTLVSKLGIQAYHRRVGEAVAAAIAPKGVIMNYGMVVRWIPQKHMSRLSDIVGTLGYIRQSREYIIAKAAGLFNTLAINDQYWGDITGVLRGLPSTWHAAALRFALLPSESLGAMYRAPKVALDEFVSAHHPADLLCSAVESNLKTGNLPLPLSFRIR